MTILIIMILGGPVNTVEHIEFTEMRTCVRAADAITARAPTDPRVVVLCTPK